MISSLFSNSTFIIVSLMALVFTIVAVSQKLNDAIKGISIVYVIFILYTLYHLKILPLKKTKIPLALILLITTNQKVTI